VIERRRGIRARRGAVFFILLIQEAGFYPLF
jgi:hypothetical protein